MNTVEDSASVRSFSMREIGGCKKRHLERNLSSTPQKQALERSTGSKLKKNVARTFLTVLGLLFVAGAACAQTIGFSEAISSKNFVILEENVATDAAHGGSRIANDCNNGRMVFLSDASSERTYNRKSREFSRTIRKLIEERLEVCPSLKEVYVIASVGAEQKTTSEIRYSIERNWKAYYIPPREMVNNPVGRLAKIGKDFEINPITRNGNVGGSALASESAVTVSGSSTPGTGFVELLSYNVMEVVEPVRGIELVNDCKSPKSYALVRAQRESQIESHALVLIGAMEEAAKSLLKRCEDLKSVEFFVSGNDAGRLVLRAELYRSESFKYNDRNMRRHNGRVKTPENAYAEAYQAYEAKHPKSSSIAQIATTSLSAEEQRTTVLRLIEKLETRAHEIRSERNGFQRREQWQRSHIKVSAEYQNSVLSELRTISELAPTQFQDRTPQFNDEASALYDEANAFNGRIANLFLNWRTYAGDRGSLTVQDHDQLASAAKVDLKSLRQSFGNLPNSPRQIRERELQVAESNRKTKLRVTHFSTYFPSDVSRASSIRVVEEELMAVRPLMQRIDQDGERLRDILRDAAPSQFPSLRRAFQSNLYPQFHQLITTVAKTLAKTPHTKDGVAFLFAQHSASRELPNYQNPHVVMLKLGSEINHWETTGLCNVNPLIVDQNCEDPYGNFPREQFKAYQHYFLIAAYRNFLETGDSKLASLVQQARPTEPFKQKIAYLVRLCRQNGNPDCAPKVFSALGGVTDQREMERQRLIALEQKLSTRAGLVNALASINERATQLKAQWDTQIRNGMTRSQNGLALQSEIALFARDTAHPELKQIVQIVSKRMAEDMSSDAKYSDWKSNTYEPILKSIDDAQELWCIGFPTTCRREQENLLGLIVGQETQHMNSPLEELTATFQTEHFRIRAETQSRYASIGAGASEEAPNVMEQPASNYEAPEYQSRARGGLMTPTEMVLYQSGESAGRFGNAVAGLVGHYTDFENKITQSRLNFQRCVAANCEELPFHRAVFSHALLTKDFQLLGESGIVQGSLAGLAVQRNALAGKLFSGRQLDGGIPQRCQILFEAWAIDYAQAYGVDRLDRLETYLFANEKQRATFDKTKGSYAIYQSCRDQWEFEQIPN